MRPPGRGRARPRWRRRCGAAGRRSPARPPRSARSGVGGERRARPRVGTRQEPVGLGDCAGDLGKVLRAGDADGDGQPETLARGAAETDGDLPRRAGDPLHAPDVEEGFVDREPLDGRRRVLEEGVERAARLRVRGHPRRDDERVRAEPSGLPSAHRGPDAVRLRLVAGGENDAAADDHRPSTQAGIVALLDRREERVGVGMQDRRVRRHDAMLAHRTYVRLDWSGAARARRPRSARGLAGGAGIAAVGGGGPASVREPLDPGRAGLRAAGRGVRRRQPGRVRGRDGLARKRPGSVAGGDRVRRLRSGDDGALGANQPDLRAGRGAGAGAGARRLLPVPGRSGCSPPRAGCPSDRAARTGAARRARASAPSSDASSPSPATRPWSRTTPASTSASSSGTCAGARAAGWRSRLCVQRRSPAACSQAVCAGSASPRSPISSECRLFPATGRCPTRRRPRRCSFA